MNAHFRLRLPVRILFGGARLLPWGTVGLALWIAGLVGNAGCASKPLQFHAMDDLLASPIRVRRLPARPASPDATPHSEDYTSDTPMGPNLNCQEPKALFQSIDWSGVLDCLGTTKPPANQKEIVAVYKLVRGPLPKLELVREPSTPVCLTKKLATIEVAREVFFLNFFKEKLTCFASRVGTDSDQMLGMRKLPKGKFEMKLTFPLENPPRTSDEAYRLLMAWSLAPFFWEESDGKLRAKIVPESICGACFANPDILKSRDYPIPKWPE